MKIARLTQATSVMVGVCAVLWGMPQTANAQSKEQGEWVDQTVEESTVDLPGDTKEEQRSPRFEAGVLMGGLLLGRDLELGVPDKPGFVSGPRTLNGEAGLRLSVEALRTVSVEVESSLAPTKDREDGIGATVLTARLHGVFVVDVDGYFAAQHFRPFILGGLGLASVVSTDGYVDALGNQYGLPKKDTDAEFHVGAGVKWDPHEMFTFRSDIRLYQMPNTKPQGLTTTWEITLGASVKFGRKWGVRVDLPY